MSGTPDVSKPATPTDISSIPTVSFHQQSRVIIKSLLAARPWDLEVFRTGLEHQRNRRIFLTAVPMTPAPISSLWLATTDADYILYERDTAPSRQVHLIGHQVAHMLFGHEGTPVCGKATRALFPDLDPDMVAAALTISAYTSADEQAADIFASLLLIRSQRLNVRLRSS